MVDPRTFTIEQKISLLLTRLSWPSGLVREKACVEIANLLKNSSYSDKVRQAVLKWIADQKLESLQAIGLLVFAYAHNSNSEVTFPSDHELTKYNRFPSLLSWIIVKDVFPETKSSIEPFLAYEQAAEPLEEPAFFRKYITGYLPPFYDFWAGKIEERGIPFHSHWAFEWKLILGRLEKDPTAREGDFWFRDLPNGERYIIIDTEMSEIYRSAYLRTLAWLVCKNGFPIESAFFLVAETCPIDLELWKLAPKERPHWWPKPKVRNSIIDSSISDLWNDLSELWNDAFIGKKTGLHHQIIARADGSVMSGDTLYEIHINGIFQRCVGANHPELSKLAEWCEGNDGKGSNALDANTCSGIAFRGEVMPKQDDEITESFDDWLVIAAANYHRLHIRWQPWRDIIFLPSPVLIHKNMYFGAEGQDLIAKEGSKPIGRFYDWTYSIRETNYGYLPYESGCVLLIPRDLVTSFCKQNKFTFCWLVTINAYYKEIAYEEKYKKFSDYRCYGASGLILP